MASLCLPAAICFVQKRNYAIRVPTSNAEEHRSPRIHLTVRRKELIAIVKMQNSFVEVLSLIGFHSEDVIARQPGAHNPTENEICQRRDKAGAEESKSRKANIDVALWNTARELLPVDLSVTANFGDQPL